MKKIGLVIITIILFSLNTNVVNGAFKYNGTSGNVTPAPSGSSGCNEYKNKYCLYNSANNVGLRFTLSYCDKNGTCTDVSSINGKAIESVDVWKTSLYKTANQFYYIGNSKNSTSGSIKKGNYSYYAAGEYKYSKNSSGKTISTYVIDYSVLKKGMFVLNPYGNNSYYNVYSDEIPVNDVNAILGLMSNDNVTFEDDVLLEMRKNSHLSSDECSIGNCYGYRIFVEPLFTWTKFLRYQNHGGVQVTISDEYIFTPSEMSYAVNTSEIAGNNDKRIAQEANSLTIVKPDVGFTVPPAITDVDGGNVRSLLKNHKIGLGLNIIDMPKDTEEDHCSIIDSFYPDLKSKTYDQLGKIGVIKYKDKTVTGEWYRDNCSCGALYKYYGDKYLGQNLFDLTKNGIKTLFNSNFFKDLKQPSSVGIKTDKWTMDKYIKRGCKYKDETGGKTCDDVISFYKGLGQDLPSMNKNEISKINFNLFNRANRTTTPWSATRYFEEGCPYNKKDCTPKYSLFEKGGVGTCYTGEIKFNDSENWEECIFTNAENDITNTTTNYKDDSLSNNYCEIYCREDLKTNFSNEIKIVKAGERFTWDQHYLLGSRTCKTKNVNWTKFDSDLKSTNQKILDEYAEYKLEEKLANVTWKRSSAPDCDWSCDSWYPEYSCPTEKDPSRTCGGGCRSGSDKDYNYTPSSTYEQFSVSGNGLKSSKSQSLSTTCGGPGYIANSETIETARNEYTNAVSSANSIVKTMNACYDTAIWDSKIYNMDPKVSVSYGDNTYSYVGKMLKTITYDKLKYNLNCKAQNVYKMTGCSGTSCSGENVGMQNCISVEMSKSGTASFKIPGDVFKYIIKDTHLSIHGDGVKDYIDSMSGIKTFKDYAAEYAGKKISFNYIDLIYGNFPVAFSTPVGIYGGISGNGDLSLKFFDLGHKIENQQTKIDSLLSIADSNTIYGEYKCDFKVIDGLIPEKSSKGDGIDVIYRPIDLDNPFPDIDGSGRVQGSNWCDTEDCSMNSSHVVDYITNNRGVKTYEIYNQEPMYTFTLTPSLLKEIRQYNKQNSYAEYYGIDDEKAYDFVCSENSKCISEYLTNLIQLTGATGRCTTNRKDNFDACRFR